MATLFGPRTTCLRLLRVGTSTAPAPITTSTKACFATTALPHHVQSFRAQLSPRPSIVATLACQQSLRPLPRARHASSSASPSSSAPHSGVTADVLTWDKFFALRQRRRYMNLVASLATAAASIVVAGPLLAAQDVDTWGAQLTGIDPVFVLGASTLAVGAVGWLCGPTFGNMAFRLWAGRKGWNTLIAQKEKSFYARIKRYRADPSSSSPQNPIPDYYGEKIRSVKDYRRWLKDQKAFNLKKDKNML